MASGNIQVKTFQWTIPPLAPQMSVPVVPEVSNQNWDDVNAFLFTLPPDNVLDIKFAITPTSKYGSVSHAEVVVIYLQT